MTSSISRKSKAVMKILAKVAVLDLATRHGVLNISNNSPVPAFCLRPTNNADEHPISIYRIFKEETQDLNDNLAGLAEALCKKTHCTSRKSEDVIEDLRYVVYYYFIFKEQDTGYVIEKLKLLLGNDSSGEEEELYDWGKMALWLCEGGHRDVANRVIVDFLLNVQDDKGVVIDRNVELLRGVLNTLRGAGELCAGALANEIPEWEMALGVKILEWEMDPPTREENMLKLWKAGITRDYYKQCPMCSYKHPEKLYSGVDEQADLSWFLECIRERAHKMYDLNVKYGRSDYANDADHRTKSAEDHDCFITEKVQELFDEKVLFDDRLSSGRCPMFMKVLLEHIQPDDMYNPKTGLRGEGFYKMISSLYEQTKTKKRGNLTKTFVERLLSWWRTIRDPADRPERYLFAHAVICYRDIRADESSNCGRGPIPNAVLSKCLKWLQHFKSPTRPGTNWGSLSFEFLEPCETDIRAFWALLELIAPSVGKAADVVPGEAAAIADLKEEDKIMLLVERNLLGDRGDRPLFLHEETHNKLQKLVDEFKSARRTRPNLGYNR